MPASQIWEPYYRYQTLKLVRPKWSRAQKIWNTIQAYASFFQQRLDIILYLSFGYFPYKTQIIDQANLAKYLPFGAIFVSIHSSTYPLAGKILNEIYPQIKLTIPFYFHRKLSIFPVFKKFFKQLQINLVPLGGAMKYIGPALESNQTVCLFLDAELPIKHTEKVILFKKLVPISSGPAFLAQKYKKPIIPIYLEKRQGIIFVHLMKPIIPKSFDSTKTITQEIAKSLEIMIDQTLSEWQVTDRFLLPELIKKI